MDFNFYFWGITEKTSEWNQKTWIKGGGVHRWTLYRKRKATAATPATGPGVSWVFWSRCWCSLPPSPLPLTLHGWRSDEWAIFWCQASPHYPCSYPPPRLGARVCPQLRQCRLVLSWAFAPGQDFCFGWSRFWLWHRAPLPAHRTRAGHRGPYFELLGVWWFYSELGFFTRVEIQNGASTTSFQFSILVF